MTSPTASIPLPEKIATLLHEVRWILLGAAGSFLALVLAGYHRTDPGFSHAVSTDRVLNPGGAFGAWLADLLYSLFGLSSWWWVALGLVFVRWGLLAAYGRADRRAHGLTLIGFVLVLSTSAALESMRFHSLAASLPLYPGGLLGHELAALLVRYVGFLGGTLIALCVFASGLSLMTGVSWLSAAERVGAGCEWLVRRVVAVCQVWQDRRAGQAVAERRETRGPEGRTRAAEAPAGRLEPPEPK
ncbi:MAG TPA: DNA translocase FtsK 4TM domain-containing protein, partial [Rhodocyclaceae bacterium]|nr:DNA translocase FtsK 4TM domain-containing protein [Rhodocyclaceae bacterium]